MKRKMKRNTVVVLLIIANLLVLTFAISPTTSKKLPNNPPYIPSNPYPANGSTNIFPHLLNWTGGDPDGDFVLFDVYFGCSNQLLLIERQITPPVLLLANLMPYNTTYYWKIVSWDNHSASAEGPIWSFTTPTNSPPYAPSNPHPLDGATDVPLNTTLSWNCSDPYQDMLTYDVFLDTSNPPMKVVSNQTETTYRPFTTLNPLTTYYWRIVAWDPLGLSNESDIWMFTTRENSPPYMPSNPNPPNGSTEPQGWIYWTGGDPDGDPVTYDLYFGKANPPLLIACNITDTIYVPGFMEYNTTYYWRIVARDNHNASTEGPLWWFKTPKPPKPDLSCEGVLSWTKIKPGSTVTGSFIVNNTGEPNSLLNWEIISWPNWGNWTFNPKQGNFLTPEHGLITVNVTVIAPNKRNQEFTGEIVIVNKDNTSDTSTIQITLKTPTSIQPTRLSQIHSYLYRILERFLNAFPILQFFFTQV